MPIGPIYKYLLSVLIILIFSLLQNNKQNPHKAKQSDRFSKLIEVQHDHSHHRPFTCMHYIVSVIVYEIVSFVFWDFVLMSRWFSLGQVDFIKDFTP